MKRCPKCNRTYPSNTQRFCTSDGGLLEVIVTPPAPPVQEDFDETDAPTKVISQELVPDATIRFDPFKTVMDSPPGRDQTSALNPTSSNVTPPAAPPRPTPPPVSQSGSQRLGETTSPSMRPEPQPPPTSQSGSQRLGETTSPSMRPAPPPPPPATPPARQTSGSLPASGSGPIAAPPLSSAELRSPQFTAAPQAQQVQHITAPPPAKKSKLPLILGILAVLFVLGVGVLSVAYFFVVKPMLEAQRIAATPSESPQQNPVEAPTNVDTPPAPEPTATTAETAPPPFTPPANAVQFVNSSDKLDGKLAEHYVDFTFYYPDNWRKDPKSGVPGASNFAKVERRLPPDFTQENFAVGWYSSSGSLQTDQSLFHSLAETMSAQFEKNFPEYRKVSEGATRVGVYDGYEFRFEGLSRDTAKGDLKLWGRVVFLPPADDGKSGVTLLMLTTSLAPELEGISDVGEKGELPMILESFRFGRPASQ
jgi:hypothetical protein